MKIGVSGASGQLGKSTLSELAFRGKGHELVAISRTPHSADSIQGRFGDYDQPDSLAEAYRGLEELLLIPSADMRPGVRGRQFRTAIDAAVQAGVGHIVLLSTAGTREAVAPSMFAAYWEGEQHLIKTAPKWTILRMNYYAESYAQVVPMSAATGVVTGLGDGRVAFVSRDDVAAAAAGILLGLGKPGAIYNATGPSSLGGTERAAIISEVTGKPVQFLILEESQLHEELSNAGVPELYIAPMMDIEKKYVEGSFDLVSGDVQRLAGRAPRTLKSVLGQILNPPS